VHPKVEYQAAFIEEVLRSPDNLAPLGAFASSAFFVAHKVAIFYSLSTHTTERTSVWSVEISWITYYAKMLKNLSYGSRLLGNTGSLKS
jgi:hypothetical protein